MNNDDFWGFNPMLSKKSSKMTPLPTPSVVDEQSVQSDDDIKAMLKAKYLLEDGVDRYGKDYEKVVIQIKQYLQDHCKHQITTDLIDIDPDKSITITYCPFCETTF